MKFKKYILITTFILFSSFQTISAEEINVAIIERPPMAFKSETNEWKGFSVDLIKKIANNLDLDLNFVEYEKFGEMIDSIKNKENKLAIANITITSKREEEMDFSQPIFDSGLQILISTKNNNSSIFDTVLKSGILWFLFGALILLLLIAHIVWFFERGTTSDRHDYFRDDYLGGIWDAFWWAFIIMTMGGFENEVPASKFSRFLAILWIITSLFFISFLTAQITSSLTVAELNSDISSYKDLSDKKVGLMNSQPVIDFVKKKIDAKVVVFDNYNDFYQALRDEKVDTLIGDSPIINYYVANNKDGKDFKVVGKIFKPEKYGILFSEKSSLKEEIDRGIIKLQESGEYQKIYNKYFK